MATLVRLPLFGRNLFEEHSFRQTQTAWVAREFFRDGIDLLKYPLQVFGPDTNLPFEMPIFQALVAALTFNVDTIEITGRSLSFLFFLLSGYLTYHLVKAGTSRSTGLVVLAIFLFSPFSLQWSSAFLIESFATTFGLLIVIAFDSWIKSGRKTWLAMGILTTLIAFLAKSTTGGTFLLLAAVSLVITHQSKVVEISKLLMRTIVFAVLAVFPALIATYFWVEHSDEMKSETSAGQALTSSALRDFISGSWQQKFDYGTWEVVFDRVVSGIWGPLGVVSVTIALFYLLWKKPWSKEKSLILGSVIVAATVVWFFINLYYIHSYYLMAVYPMLATAFGVSVVSVLRSLEPKRFTLKLVFLISAVVQLTFHLTEPSSSQLFTGFKASTETPALSSIVSANSEPSDLILMVNCDWDPTILYFADRKGYMVRNTFESVSDQSKLIFSESKDNYKLLVFCVPVESPSSYVPDTVWLTTIPTEVGQVFRINDTLVD
jgi:hypothetical protein